MSARPIPLPEGVGLVPGRHYGLGFWAGRNVAVSGFVQQLEDRGFTVEGGLAGIVVEAIDGGFVHRMVLDNDLERSRGAANGTVIGAASRGANVAVPFPIDWYVIDEAEWERTHSLLGRLEQGVDAHVDAAVDAARRMDRNIGRTANRLLEGFESWGRTMQFVAIGTVVVAGVGALAWLVRGWGGKAG